MCKSATCNWRAELRVHKIIILNKSRDQQSAAFVAMQSCVADIRNWLLLDKLKSNNDKIEIIILGA